MSRPILIIGLIIGALLIGGCSSNGKVPDLQLKEVTVKDLVPQPSRFSMEPPAKPEPIKRGSQEAEASKVITKNNLIAKQNETKLLLLQESVRNMFK